MKKINDKTIRGIIVVVGLALSFVLILMIGSKFKKEPVSETQIPQQSSETNDVVVEKPEITEKEITVPPITTSEKINEDTAPIDKGTDQKIQNDVTKPEYTEDQLTDPTQKPTGEEVEPPAKDDSEIETTEPPQQNDEPQGGDTRNGEIYVPGFGWIEDEGGGGEGTIVDDMYENGNKIGEMG